MRAHHQLIGAIVGEHAGEIDIRELACHFGHDLAPQPVAFHDVGFVAADKPCATAASKREPASREAGDLHLVIGCHVIAAAFAPGGIDAAFGGEHGAAAHLPEDHHICLAENVGPEWRAMPQRRPGPRRPQPQKGLQLPAQIHQPVLTLRPAGDANVVPLRSAHSANQYRVACLCLPQHVFGAECAVTVPRGAMKDIMLDIE